MKRERSWTELEYRQAYRDMRRENGSVTEDQRDGMSQFIFRAADYSYQAKDHAINAWSNGLRFSRFLSIKWRILSREELPF